MMRRLVVVVACLLVVSLDAARLSDRHKHKGHHKHNSLHGHTRAKRSHVGLEKGYVNVPNGDKAVHLNSHHRKSLPLHAHEEDFTTGGGDEGRSTPGGAASSAGGAASSAWDQDVAYYGTCLKDYRMLTSKEHCGFAAGRPGGVTLQFAKCYASEMAVLNMAYKSGEARKQIIHHGVGSDVDQMDSSSQIRHITQKCKAGVAYACASDTTNSSAVESPQREACRGKSVPAGEVPASIGQDSRCPAKLLQMEAHEGHLYDALAARAKDVAHAFRDVPDSSFDGGSKTWGAAVAVCWEISQVGVGGPYAGANEIPDSAHTTSGLYGQPSGPVPTSLEEEENIQKCRNECVKLHSMNSEALISCYETCSEKFPNPLADHKEKEAASQAKMDERRAQQAQRKERKEREEDQKLQKIVN